MGEAKRRKKLDENYGKSRKQLETQSFKILDFDGHHYEIQNLSMNNAIKAKSSEEVMINWIAGCIGVPKIGRSNIAWVTCKQNLTIGSVVQGRFNEDPRVLAKKYKFAELIIDN